MVLFIRNIPEHTFLLELYDFAAPALKSALPLLSGKVIKAEILGLENKYTKLVEFHGLVHVDSEKAGKAAIKKLNGKRFKGKPMQVAETI